MTSLTLLDKHSHGITCPVLSLCQFCTLSFTFLSTISFAALLAACCRCEGWGVRKKWHVACWNRRGRDHTRLQLLRPCALPQLLWLFPERIVKSTEMGIETRYSMKTELRYSRMRSSGSTSSSLTRLTSARFTRSLFSSKSAGNRPRMSWDDWARSAVRGAVVVAPLAKSYWPQYFQGRLVARPVWCPARCPNCPPDEWEGRVIECSGYRLGCIAMQSTLTLTSRLSRPYHELSQPSRHSTSYSYQGWCTNAPWLRP